MRFIPLLLALTLAGCAQPAPSVAPAAIANATLPADPISVVHALGENATGGAREASGIVPALFSLKHDAGEPTLGVTKDGTIFYAAITFKNDIPVLPVTDILRSKDGGTSWTDVTPRLPGGIVRTHFETGDPYVYVDPATGRVFDIDQRLLTTCHTVTFSDDRGATWSTDAPTCVSSAGADHHTIVAAKKRSSSEMFYPNMVFVCWNSDAGPACSRSLDGGQTFVPAAPPFLASDGGPKCGLVGHLKASRDGVLYLPRDCDGTVKVARSDDDGMSWTVTQAGTYEVPKDGDPEYDPAVAVDAAGHVHVVWEDPQGQLWLSSSADAAKTWSKPLKLLPPTLTVGHLPALAAGADGRLVVAYMGSATKDGYQTSKDDAKREVWHGYLALVDDALGAPVVTTTRVDPAEDPLVHGACGPSFRCPGAFDFLDVVIDADGRPWASFVDACSATCAATPDGKDDQAIGMVATLREGPSLLANATLPAIHGSGSA